MSALANDLIITDDADLRHYRVEIPNIIDEMDLSVYAFRLYSHFKRRAGSNGGVCYAGTRSIAEHCGMSVGAVWKAKRELLQRRLITIEAGNPKESRPDHIRLNNIWATNFAYFNAAGPEKGEVRQKLLADFFACPPVHHVNTPPCSSGEHPCSPPEHPCSPGEHEEETNTRMNQTKKERVCPPISGENALSEKGTGGPMRPPVPAGQGKGATEALAASRADRQRQRYMEWIKANWDRLREAYLPYFQGSEYHLQWSLRNCLTWAEGHPERAARYADPGKRIRKWLDEEDVERIQKAFESQNRAAEKYQRAVVADAPEGSGDEESGLGLEAINATIASYRGAFVVFQEYVRQRHGVSLGEADWVELAAAIARDPDYFGRQHHFDALHAYFEIPVRLRGEAP